MKRESIIFTLTVSFVISILFVIASFLVLITHNYQNNQHHLKKKYSPIAKMVLEHNKRQGLTPDFKASLEDMGFDFIDDINILRGITYNPKTVVEFEKDFRNITIRVLSLKSEYYLYIKHSAPATLGGMEVILKDNQSELLNGSLYIIAVFGIIVTTLIFSYLTILKKIYPLKILKEKVSFLGEENFDFECCDTTKQDEVSLLAMEFKKAAQKLNSIKESRNVFIRNIMHELKTPITKGKFLTQLPHDEKNDEKMVNVFNRLESLINEFGLIEELISASKHMEQNFYYLNDIVDNAIDVLMIDEDVVESHFDNIKLHVNYNLFSVAVKNLIDNGIKHSSDKKVLIRTQNEDIIFENSGKPLAHDLEAYFEPFFASEYKDKESFGLGLYIVNSILKASEYTLEYTYENDKNIFKIVKKES